ncbi:MAG: hypothetical protein KatS3mg115_1716 [Candidatus Poribacteria bacterium]|nr:MAG: hypothetical protein KatS3mg115_1716 [Candidatus Poribacteria bacterium]
MRELLRDMGGRRFGWAVSLLFLIGSFVRGDSVLIHFVGDVMIARRFEEPGSVLREEGLEAIFNPTRPILLSGDLGVANLETPLTTRG